MYFNSPKDFTGFRDKPSGVVLLEECNVRSVDTGAVQKYTFMLAHPNGETVVLAAETEKEMHEWMQAVRTSRMCITDPDAANQTEGTRRAAAESELSNALGKHSNTDEALSNIEKELEAVQVEHREVEIEKEKAEKELKELMARFKLRKALLHWRHRKLTLSFRTLVRSVFRERILAADSKKTQGDARLSAMQDEMDAATAARQKAEAAKRRSEEMLTKELAMKKDGEAEARELERLLALEGDKAQKTTEEIERFGSEAILDSREKEDVLQLGLMLAKIKADSEMTLQQLKRRGASKST
jgi:DNA repair exonuclease SbcCD ATPase subunit